MIAVIHVTLEQVAATLALVAVAVGASVWQRADLERDIAIAVIRSFIQLTAIGYVIKLIFERMPATMELAVCAILLAVLLCIPLDMPE